MTGVKRNSNIELIKVLAIFAIVLCYSLPMMSDSMVEVPNWFIDYQASTENIQYLLIIFFRYGGQIGNAVFIICSSWYLLESKMVNGVKVGRMVVDCFFVSVVGLVIAVLFQCELTMGEVFNAIFITKILDHYWFVLCYGMFYILHSYLNLIIDNMGQKQHFTVNSVLVFLYSVVYFVIGGRHFYYTSLVGFICVHFYTSYIKKYYKKINMKKGCSLLMWGILFNTVLTLVQNVLGIRFEFMSEFMGRYNWFNNPFILMIAYGMFFIAISAKKRDIKIINSISGLSLLIYVVHAHPFVSQQLLARVYSKLYEREGYDNILVWYILIGTGVFVVSVLLAFLYKALIQPCLYKINDKCCALLARQWEKFCARIL